MSNPPESAPLFGWRCNVCAEYLEIATNQPARITEPECPRCGLEMQRDGNASDILAPIGKRYRTSNCLGCGLRIRLIPIAEWDDFCSDCRTARSGHPEGADHDWLPSDTHRSVVSDQLLSQVFFQDPHGAPSA